jgi:hypothetical protein
MVAVNVCGQKFGADSMSWYKYHIMNTCNNPLCNKNFVVKPGCLGKYCSLSCGTAHRNAITQEKRYHEYNISPILCKHCNKILPYKNRKNKFCSSSCSAIFSNANKDYLKIKSGPKKGHVPKNYAPYTKVKQCVICNKYHGNQGKTCSLQCLSQHISNSVRGKTGGNRDLNLPGVDCDGKMFYYDSGWEVTLAKSLTDNNIYWTRPSKFLLSNGRSYTPDFYLPEYNVYIDPKAKRPGYYRDSVLKIEMFEQEYNKKCLIISDQTLLSWHQIQTMLLVSNYRS